MSDIRKRETGLVARFFCGRVYVAAEPSFWVYQGSVV